MNNISKKSVLSAEMFLSAAVKLTLIYFFFINLFENFFDSGLVGRIYVTIIFLAVAFFIIFNKRWPQIKINIFWLLFLIIMVSASKWAIENNNLYWVMIYCTLIGLLFVLPSNAAWTEKLWPTLITIGMIHVFATILFYVCSPWLYENIMLPIWGTHPGGVTQAEAYKAGLSNHYSTNGIYCSAVCLILGAKLIVNTDAAPKQRRRDIICLVLAIFALLLTTKRGPLLFALLALVVTYYICNPHNGVSKSFYIVLGVSLALIVFYLFAPLIPLFGNILSRFSESDDISNNRFLFWEKAYELFTTSKTWGIGWGAFIRRSRTGTSAHNIYIQLLCETGIVGLIVFLTALISTYTMAVRDYRKNRKTMTSQQKYVLGCSIAVLTYVIAYGFTGNCLYDMTIFFFMLAVAASVTMHQVLNPRRSKIQRLM